MFSFKKNPVVIGTTPAFARSAANGPLVVRSLQVGLKNSALPAGSIPLIDGIDLTLAPGERMALVGESGSGKSLTAAALMGLIDLPLAWSAKTLQIGGINLLGLNLQHWRDVRGGCIALVQQDPLTALSPVFNVGSQIAETIARHLPLKGRAAWDEAVKRMDEVGIPDATRRALDYPHQLSGGLRQRVAIAIALAAQPAVVLADEPTTALDVTVQAQIIDLLRTLSEKKGMALLFITHDLGLLPNFAHRVAVMYAGRIVESGPTDLLLTEPRHPYTAALVSAQPGLNPSSPRRRLSTIAGMPPAPAERPTGCAFAPRCTMAEDLCHQVRPALRMLDGREVACHRAEMQKNFGATE